MWSSTREIASRPEERRRCLLPSTAMAAITTERKREIAAHFGANEQDTGTTGCRSRSSPSGSTTSPSTCARRERPPLPPRAADARRRSRRFLAYLQRGDLEGYRELIQELGLRK